MKTTGLHSCRANFGANPKFYARATYHELCLHFSIRAHSHIIEPWHQYPPSIITLTTVVRFPAFLGNAFRKHSSSISAFVTSWSSFPSVTQRLPLPTRQVSSISHYLPLTSSVSSTPLQRALPAMHASFRRTTPVPRQSFATSIGAAASPASSSEFHALSPWDRALRRSVTSLMDSVADTMKKGKAMAEPAPSSGLYATGAFYDTEDDDFHEHMASSTFADFVKGRRTVSNFDIK